MFTPGGRTYFRAFPSLLRLQPARLAVMGPVLMISIHDGFPGLRAMISWIGMRSGGEGGVTPRGVPLLEALTRQFAGSSGSPAGSLISSDAPPDDIGHPAPFV